MSEKTSAITWLQPKLGTIVSILVAPMYTGRKDLGTISLHSSHKSAFDDSDQQFLETLAAQGALTLANVELFKNRLQGRRQLSDILAASLKFNPSISLHSTAEDVANIVCKYSGFNMAVVNLLDKQSNLTMSD